jgi:hypothetical protein
MFNGEFLKRLLRLVIALPGAIIFDRADCFAKTVGYWWRRQILSWIMQQESV